MIYQFCKSSIGKFTKSYNKFSRNYKKRKIKLRQKGIFQYLFNSSGYILIIVLIIISLLVSISTEFLHVAQTNMNYIRKFNERLKARTLAKSGMNLAPFILMVDERGLVQSFLGKKNIDKNIDCYDDIWALNFPELPIDEGFLKIKIEDENAKINLSVLANEVVDKTPYYAITQRFFLNMGLPMDFADAIIDWVDIDDSRYPYGAESSDYYLNLDFPYSTKNSSMDSITELLMIKDMTPEIFYGINPDNYPMEDNLVDNNKGNTDIDLGLLSASTPEDMLESLKNMGDNEIKFNIGKEKSRRLSDYFRVNGERGDYLSELNKININTASYRVLLALTENMTDEIVTELISRRLSSPFKSVDDVKDLIEDETIRKNNISVKSYIFKITAIGSFNNSSVKIMGIYYRTGKKFLYWSEQ